MKKITPLIIALAFIVAHANAQRQAAEIYFQQDSVVPNQIYLSVKLIEEVPLRDSLNISWGDGNSSWIYLTDTIQIPGLSFPLYNAIYRGSYSYGSVYLDSIVSVGCVAYWPREQGVINIGGGAPNNVQLYIGATINFQILRNMRGYQSPYFAAPLYIYDSTGQVLTYDPQLYTANLFSTKTNFIAPQQAYDIPVPAYVYPNRVYLNTTDTTLVCDSIHGIITWNYPSTTGLYDVATQITQYKGDTMVSSVMQDMLIAIVQTPSGITNISGTTTLRIYPSPTSGSFTIDMSGYVTGDRQVSIYDQLGQAVCSSTTDQDRMLINNKLSQGLYYVEVTEGGRRGYDKVVVE